jgi:DnaJ family protein C protein 27
METTATPRRRILVVDDDERIVTEIVRELSDHWGFEVSTCGSGQAARMVLQQSRFDLLITDWQLPDLDGLTLIRETQERSPETVTVLMTAFGSDEIGPLAHAYAHHYIEKPFLVEELANVISSIFPAAHGVSSSKPLVLKVVLGGDAQVGKTSLIQRYCTGRFDPLRKMTIGVDFHLYDVRVDQTPTRLVLWDMGGQERFAFARRAFYRGTQAVGLVFDASNRASFYNLTRWWREAREFLPEVPMLLLANKIDLPRQVSIDEMTQVAKAWNISYYQTSCANGEGVAEFFEALAARAVSNTYKLSIVEMPVGK